MILRAGWPQSAAAAAEADFERLCRRDPLFIARREFFCTDGFWDADRLADAHAGLDDEEEDDEDAQFLSRMGWDYGGGGFDRPPPDLGNLKDLSRLHGDNIEWEMAAYGFKDDYGRDEDADSDDGG